MFVGCPLSVGMNMRVGPAVVDVHVKVKLSSSQLAQSPNTKDNEHHSYDQFEGTGYARWELHPE